MKMNEQYASVSPIDGRYRNRFEPEELSGNFSEFAITKAKIDVEVMHVLALNKLGVFDELSHEELCEVYNASKNFDYNSFLRLKDIEKVIKHDTKSCEVFLRETCNIRNKNMIHFGLTSEDVNNLAYSMCFKRFVNDIQIPMILDLLSMLSKMMIKTRDMAFPARTHGQLASPTTAGKEMSVFAGRLLRSVVILNGMKFYGKLNGATGNRSAFNAAAPRIDWEEYEKTFVSDLGFIVNESTTQIEDHDSWARWMNETTVCNNILIDLVQDMWLYISNNLFKQTPKNGEVGSSTMPHKVNPINFENAEGNLQLSNSMLSFISNKITKSRMQRDLSDSSVIRNIGLAMGHSILSYKEIKLGMEKVEVNEIECARQLESAPEVLSEAIQSVLRRHKDTDVYSALLEVTRGKNVTINDMKEFIKKEDIPDDTKEYLLSFNVFNYVGDAQKIVDRVNNSIARELSSMEFSGFHKKATPLWLASFEFSKTLEKQPLEFIADAKLDGSSWSTKIKLAPHTNSDRTYRAYASFLNPDAPYKCGVPISVALGDTVIGTLIVF